jgi:hypothetical protein
MTNDVPSPSGHPFPADDARIEAAANAGAVDEGLQGLDGNREQTADEERLSKLPPEEHDADRTVGGGMLDAGGTAIERGTGTLSGEAQDRDVEADDENTARPEIDDDLAYPSEPGGGTH